MIQGTSMLSALRSVFVFTVPLWSTETDILILGAANVMTTLMGSAGKIEVDRSNA